MSSSTSYLVFCKLFIGVKMIMTVLPSHCSCYLFHASLASSHYLAIHNRLSYTETILVRALSFSFESTCFCVMVLLTLFPARATFNLKDWRERFSTWFSLSTSILLSIFSPTVIMFLNVTVPTPQHFYHVNLISD